MPSLGPSAAGIAPQMEKTGVTPKVASGGLALQELEANRRKAQGVAV